MRFVIQRVNHAKCTIDGNITGSIEKGLCVLIGIAETDTKEIADKMIKKLINMRIFADENDKTNLSINDVDGSFCSYRSLRFMQIVRKGNRPSFVEAGSPDMANELMNTASASVIRQFQEYKEGCLEPIEDRA